MKFGQEYQKALASEDFPDNWRESAIEYKHLKKCINKIHKELEALGLDSRTLTCLSEWIEQPTAEPTPAHHTQGFYSAAKPTLASVPEEFTPQLRVLVDSKTGLPLDATLTPETRASLQKLARHEMVTAGRRNHLDNAVQPMANKLRRRDSGTSEFSTIRRLNSAPQDARWIQVPLASARDFFDMLEPKLQELEALRAAETEKLEEEILDLGDAVEDVVEPVREGFEARRSVSYRDLYFWREMFRLYMEKPVFYSETGARHGALTFNEAKARLEEYDGQLRSSGLLTKMKTLQAKRAAKQFLDLNVDILRILHFQEMNAKAMSKILKKFDKRTHLEGQQFLQTLRTQYPALITNGKAKSSTGGFANSIARDMHAEIASKVLGIVPQPTDWNCPVCQTLAWRPVNLGCCKSAFCMKCILHLQSEGVQKCPVCSQETVMKADGRNIDFEAMDFLEKYFPLEVKKKESQTVALIGGHSEETVKAGCEIM